MNFENLQLFRDISLNRSVSRAAELSDITPSAASQTVNELEKSMGVLLLDRSTRPLSLTDAGKLFSDFCRDVLRRKDEFEAVIGELQAVLEGTVRVAAIYSVGLSEMSRLEEEFRKRCPGSLVDVEYLRPEKIYEAVERDQVDLGLVSYPEPTREIAVMPWRLEEMVVAAIPPHPLMKRKSISPADLNAADFIMFDDDLPIGREVGRYLRSHNVHVNTTMRFDNLQTIKEALLIGSGVSIVPARMLKSELADGRLAAVPLAEPGLSRPLGIIYRKRKKFHRAAQAFLDLLREPRADEQMLISTAPGV